MIQEQVEEITDDSGDELFDVGNLLEDIVFKALAMRSSDIHIEPKEKNVVVRYRIDGMLREVLKIDKDIEQALIFKIKVASKLRTDEHFAPQDGRIKFIREAKSLDTRISILPTTKGEKVVIRLLSQEGRSFKLEDLGLEGKELEFVEKSMRKPYGMILTVGPTGSGKTTTLYSILTNINSPEINVTTIEDPVEYEIDGVNHIQINLKTNLTFATGLRSILRQDPDVVMVGEIRDNETARIAINAALTGHLVLSTLHTNDAVTTIPRLIDMGIEPYLVASTVNTIIAQRLCRLLCPHCKKEYKLTKEELDFTTKVRKDIGDKLEVGDKYYKKVGCQECGNTGYKGRIGIYEILDVDEQIRKLISMNSTVDEVFRLARKNGLHLIVENSINRLKDGLIDIAEIMRVTAMKD
jgi:type II secretory ATPase GspE/PulE/Tfp pilus assembly ATPase PilB-like protein